MMRFSISIIFALIQLSVFSQTFENYKSALSILEKAQNSMRGGRSIVVSIKGTIHNLFHYETPEKTKTKLFTLRVRGENQFMIDSK